MSYFFQPTADSSDDEEADLASWQKTTASRPSVQTQRTAEISRPTDNISLPDAHNPPDLASPKLSQADDTDEDFEDAIATLDAVAEHNLSVLPGDERDQPARGSGDQSDDTLPQITGFTSINKPAQQTTSFHILGGELLSGSVEDRTPSRSRRLVPVLPVWNQDDLKEYEDYTEGADIVKTVDRKLQVRNGGVLYEVEFEDSHIDRVDREKLISYANGFDALAAFQSTLSSASRNSRQLAERTRMSLSRQNRQRGHDAGFVNTVSAVPLSDSDFTSEDGRPSPGRKRKRSVHRDFVVPDDFESESDDSDDIEQVAVRRSTRSGQTSHTRRKGGFDSPSDSESSDGEDSSSGRNLRGPRKLRLKGPTSRNSKTGRPRNDFVLDDTIRASRHSGRSTRHQGAMQEVGENEIYRFSSDEAPAPPRPKAVGAREVYKILPRNDDFRIRHHQRCDTCRQDGNFAPLIYCQGCVLAYHKSCLGTRATREHLTTKIADKDFVLQCRRCVAYSRKKDPTAPDLGKCGDCREYGHGCRPFRPRKTNLQEQKEREDNSGLDPIYDVDESRLYVAENVLFRCLQCFRAFHFEHLPSRSNVMDMELDIDAEQRFREYSRDWTCKECLTMPAKPSGLIAWKPIDEDSYDISTPYNQIDEDQKAYLIKWEGKSYFRACWMPGAWVWGITAAAMRHAFAKRPESQYPTMRTEDAIPEDYLRADIVLDIKFTSIVDIGTEEIDKARIREVDKAFIKYKGLGYEDVVWEEPPSPEDGDRWTDFVTAYNDWVLGRYVRQPRPSLLKTKLDKARLQEFSKLEKQAQPENLTGGELMRYQLDGLNWLYFKWFSQKNAILADEMGLGKTIQVIGFLATLVQDWNCFPFLIVVPNSTCPNWRRECKRWAPSLRIVAYYGTRESRDRIYKYELFPNGSKEPRCHIVVTSYEAASDDSSRKFLRSVNWQGLIVDEGQRLKNDRNLLYSALGALKCSFKVLLTGTPMQNNQRELFNLLHFLDSSYNAEQLEQEYSDNRLDSVKITELHELIRPFFLRRTKLQVLTFLPPMAQIILPISMSVVQKTLCRNIIAKDPELVKAIFATTNGTVKQAERASLNNILMQLRKCLCHPFVYSQSIEDRNVDYQSSHRNLVDASGKLKLLELLLPKLKDMGHRVLIFSQFLEMLDIIEDFLDGLQLRYQRLDGSINALQKQKRIDEFNAPDSTLFAFLLSTRAGGVGINLATADTVIILDPDFNPHQDIQALSRAHRIGQQNKVLCFQLVTRASAEERIMHIGRKKLALDHVLIQEMDAGDANETDFVSVLRHGAAELFEDNGDQDIQYDAASVERLLDRSHIENTQSGEDKSAEAQFSFARVWANDEGRLRDNLPEEPTELAPNTGVWENILKERERLAAAEAAKKAETFGRGRRARGTVDYATNNVEGVGPTVDTPARKRGKDGDESDTDFQAEPSSDDDDNAGEELKRDELAGLDKEASKPDADRIPGRSRGKQNSLSKKTVAAKQSTAVQNPPKKTTKAAPSKVVKTPQPSRVSKLAKTPRQTAKRKTANPTGPSEQVKKPSGAVDKKSETAGGVEQVAEEDLQASTPPKVDSASPTAKPTPPKPETIDTSENHLPAKSEPFNTGSLLPTEVGRLNDPIGPCNDADVEPIASSN